MTMVAVTDIRFGRGDEGETFIAAEEEVSGLPDDVMEELVAAGSVVEENLPEATQEKIEALENEVAALRSQLGIREGKQNVSEVVFEANGGVSGVPEGAEDVDEDDDFVDLQDAVTSDDTDNTDSAQE